MRSSPEYIKELSLVVEESSQIVAHTLFSQTKIVYEDGSVKPTVTFGPICVDPKHQQRGIGSYLIKETLKKAKDLGHKAVTIVLSYPEIYLRFGFKCCK